MSRRDKWCYEELVLALDLYLHHGNPGKGPSLQDIQELSGFLSQMPVHPEGYARTPGAVRRKLGNFARFDPDAGKGLTNVSRKDETVWREFEDDRDRLRREARRIRSAAEEIASSLVAEYSGPNVVEGKLTTRLHHVRERSRGLVEEKKASVLCKSGALVCEACGFDFERVYGARGRGFAECHHITPLAELSGVRPTRLSDLAIVCANCHRMIHRSHPWLTVEQVRALVQTD